jgi:hypothetical protein
MNAQVPSDERVHELKVHFDFWPALASGEKPFELRVNDRDYRPGDILHLRAIAMTNGHDDNSTDYVYLDSLQLRKRVTFVLKGEAGERYGLKPGYCILGIENE